MILLFNLCENAFEMIPIKYVLISAIVSKKKYDNLANEYKNYNYNNMIGLENP
jgi:hypothetical protein